MSILLEALRKSEKKQRPHETPTIHSDVQSGSPAESMRALPLSLLLVAVLLLTGWFVWRQYRVPEGGYKPPVTLSADRVTRAPQPASADQDAQGAAAKPPAPTGARQKRTPVESYQPPAQDESATAIAHTPPAAGAQPDSASAEDKAANAVAETPPTATRKKAASAGGKKVAGKETAAAKKPAKKNKDSAKTEEAFHPGEPEPIGYWELPDAVRADVPEIKFSVLVYAADPADRFVLVNGERLGEGDSLKPGLVVKEIRREGVVFSYRLYQFLVER